MFLTYILRSYEFATNTSNETNNINFDDIGHESIVRLLLENGAGINAINKYNNTALILAVWAGKIISKYFQPKSL